MGRLVHGEFDGDDYVSSKDRARLTGQIKRVHRVLISGAWLTVPDIQRWIYQRSGIKDPETSISAQIRNLRKDAFGGFTIIRRSRLGAARGVYEYHLENGDQVQEELF